MDLMDAVRRPVAHSVKLSSGGKEPLVGSLCVSAYYLLYSTRRHEGQDEITVRVCVMRHSGRSGSDYVGARC